MLGRREQFQRSLEYIVRFIPSMYLLVFYNSNALLNIIDKLTDGFY
jgi:hypothetical protein